MSPTGTRKPPPSRALTTALPLLAVGVLVLIGAIISVTRSSGDEPPAGNAAVDQGENVKDPTLVLARDLSAQMAKPWPEAQRHDGRYKSAVGGNTRYGESLMGFALIQHGLDNDQDELVDSGLKALAYSVPRLGTQNRDSIFEALGIVGAYKRLKADMPDDPRFRKLRPKMESYLSDFELVRLPATSYYGNHWLVESVLVQELLTSGLKSKNPHAVVGGERRQAARLAEDLINERIPRMAREKNFKAGRERAFVLSDPPDDPLAYQGLSLGFYARAIQLLGKRASTAAYRTLIRVANAATWLAAPDGDLAYFGRNQEQAWALGGTIYGAEVAAGLDESPARAEGRYRALGTRALERLRDDHGTGHFGLHITPAVKASRKGGEKGVDGG